MFKKKPNIKPLAPLRSSDRRRTADQIIKDLALDLAPEDPNTTPEEKAAATQARTNLRNSLLPDNALSARFTTTHGPDLKQVSGTVYVGSHEGDEQRVLWVSLEGSLFPTVYTLWRNPGIIPLLHCGSSVVERLRGGADLMTPGLINGPPFPPKAVKGAIVAVAGHDRPGVPLVVGVCEIDVAGLKEVRGAKGHAVRTVHWSGDEIWGWSAGGRPGGEPPDELAGWLRGDSDLHDLQGAAEELNLADGKQIEGGVALGSMKDDGDSESLEEKDKGRDFPQQEIDEAFKKAFLYGINSFKSSQPNVKNHGLDFPLTQTFVMSTLVNPFLPAFTSHEASQLQIKKSSFKNIKKFIKSLDKQRLVKSKDKGDEVVIQDIDFNDRSVLEFMPYRLPKKEAASSSTSTQVENGSDSSIGQKLKLQILYKPKDKLDELLTTAKADQKAFYTASEIKAAVVAYIETESLINPTNKRLVKLDPYLANTIFDGNTAVDKEALSRGSIPRDTLADRILQSHCLPFHTLTRISSSSADSTTLATVKPKPGAPPKITITMETRSGNKVATKVSGLEAFSIPPQPLADELRKACAGSTSVERSPGSSPKNPVMEVMVQGPQSEAVQKALESRGVERRWVEVLDKTKGKRKAAS